MEEECKGLFFRYKQNDFVNSKGEIVHNTRMVPLRRISCKGCSECDWLLESLEEDMRYGDKPPIQNNMIRTHIYRLTITNIEYGYESGVIDDWDLEFVDCGEG